MNDKLINCPRCSGDCCYESEVSVTVKNYQCLSCGFMTNSIFKLDSEFYKEQIEILPELYKDLLFIDSEGRVWMPATINIPEKGMIFADGTSVENWMWAAVLAVDIPEDERINFPIPNNPNKFYERKMDMKTIKRFSERDFLEALSYINVLPQ